MNKAPRSEEAIFAAAVSLPQPERGPYLEGACSGDAALQARIELLLRIYDQSRGLLTDSPGDAMRTALASIQPELAIGQALGRYKLLEKIGEGGCGIVYMAEQEEPIRRRVALKVIKLGMDTKEVIARFEAERQALAMMDHPNIAKVFDADTTATGRPYFVMELVRGIPITRYCDDNNLSTVQRLELFLPSLPGGAARAPEGYHSP